MQTEVTGALLCRRHLRFYSINCLPCIKGCCWSALKSRNTCRITCGADCERPPDNFMVMGFGNS